MSQQDHIKERSVVLTERKRGRLTEKKKERQSEEGDVKLEPRGAAEKLRLKQSE